MDHIGKVGVIQPNRLASCSQHTDRVALLQLGEQTAIRREFLRIPLSVEVAALTGMSSSSNSTS